MCVSIYKCSKRGFAVGLEEDPLRQFVFVVFSLLISFIVVWFSSWTKNVQGLAAFEFGFRGASPYFLKKRRSNHLHFSNLHPFMACFLQSPKQDAVVFALDVCKMIPAC